MANADSTPSPTSTTRWAWMAGTVPIVALGTLLAWLLQRIQATNALAARDDLRRHAIFLAILIAWMLIEKVLGRRRRPLPHPPGPFGRATRVEWKPILRTIAIGSMFLLFGMHWVLRLPPLEIAGAAGCILICVPLVRLAFHYPTAWLFLGRRLDLDFHRARRLDPAFFAGEVDGVRLAILRSDDRRYRISIGSGPHAEITRDEITHAAQTAGLSDLAWPEFDDWCGERGVGPDARIRKLPSIHGSTHCVTFRGRLQDADRFVRTLLTDRSTPGPQDDAS
ncbi:MAG: hypothetical protein V3T86_16590 [Planctomycetota bacterium]